jgi:hypothetical protein
MARGRRANGPGLVEALEGSEEAKTRMKVIVETLAGTKSVQEACEDLGIGKSAFHQIRTESLIGALEKLEPKPRGRPRQELSGEQQDLERLRKENDQLKVRLQVAHVREELALVMPEVLKGAEAKKKLMDRRRKRRRRIKSQKTKGRRRGS